VTEVSQARLAHRVPLDGRVHKDRPDLLVTKDLRGHKDSLVRLAIPVRRGALDRSAFVVTPVSLASQETLEHLEL